MNRNLIAILALATASAAMAGDGLDAGSMVRLRALRSGFSATRHDDGSHRMKRKAADSVKTVGGFMELNPGYTVADLADETIEIRETHSGMLLVRMNIEDVEKISNHPAVARLSLEREVAAKMDRVRTATGVDRLHAGEVLSHPYTGKGVLCASIDGGFDPNHVNFRNADGTSRIQNFTYFRPTQTGEIVTENYGPEYMPTIDTENSTTFHGTHTLGIMAGGYRGKVKAASIDGDISKPESCKAVIEEIDNPYYGIAYESDIAIASGVSTDYLIAMGVEEVLNYAWNRQEQLGKPYPVVINISMGNNSGPHDGSSYLSKYLDEISEEDYTNNVVCIAAGNEGDLAISLHNIFSEDNNTVKTGLKSFNTDPVEFPNILYGPVYVYSDSDEPFEIQATVYNKERGSVIFRGVAGIPTGEELGSSRYYATSSEFQGSSSDIVSEQLGRYFNGYIGIIGFWDEDSGRYMGVIDPLLWENEENGGNYVVVVEVKGSANHQVDFYTDGNFFEFDDLGLAEQGLLKGTTDGTIADTATGKNVVVVGSYNTRDQWASLDGEIYSYDLFNKSEVSLFSSWGTLLDGRELPHVCAPGATVISSTNEYYLEDNGVGIDNLQATVDADGRRYSWHQCVGTSMSTPVVAGAIALWKEADPTLRYDDIQDIIAKTAVKDADVTANPAERVKWGAGKFNAFDGLLEVLRRKGIDGIKDVTANPGNQFIVNPTGNGVYNVIAAGADKVNVSVYSLSGAKVAETSGVAGEVTVDLSGLQKGIYLMNVNGVHTEKIILN